MITSLKDWKKHKESLKINESNTELTLLAKIAKLDKWMMHYCKNSKLQLSYEDMADDTLDSANAKTWDKAIRNDENSVQHLYDTFLDRAEKAGFSLTQEFSNESNNLKTYKTHPLASHVITNDEAKKLAQFEDDEVGPGRTSMTEQEFDECVKDYEGKTLKEYAESRRQDEPQEQFDVALKILNKNTNESGGAKGPLDTSIQNSKYGVKFTAKDNCFYINALDLYSAFLNINSEYNIDTLKNWIDELRIKEEGPEIK